MKMTVENVAQLCHEANRAYCAAMGDLSHLPWDQAPEWQRDSAMKGVQAHYSSGGMTPEESHGAWLIEKQRTGWVYGMVKNPEKKEHPCMVPYVDLPVEQRAKDFIFGAITKTCRAISDEAMGDGEAGRS